MIKNITKQKTTWSHELPEQPGIYIFFDETGTILYIGKAKNIKNRVLSYFRSEKNIKTERLIQEYDSIDWIITSNELHALLLEASLIYQHKPRYNVLLKEGSPFLYICCNDGSTTKLPKIELCRTKQNHESKTYFGPCIQRQNTRKLFEFLTRTFQLQTCTKNIPSGCLDYHLNRCAGTCRSDFDKEAYVQRYYAAKALLMGNKKACVEFLEKIIQEKNAQYNFEISKKIFQLLEEITPLLEQQTYKKQSRIYAQQLTLLLEKNLPSEREYAETANEIQSILSLPMAPERIDCFDVSHCQGTNIVAACVRFNQGKPDPSNYKRFIIKTLTKQDDYKALQEAITRRYANAEDYPDLILIDGGKGQLHAAEKILTLKKCAVASLAKREERLFSANLPEGLVLNTRTPVGKLFISLRNHTHNQAVSLHRIRACKNFQTKN